MSAAIQKNMVGNKVKLERVVKSVKTIKGKIISMMGGIAYVQEDNKKEIITIDLNSPYVLSFTVKRNITKLISAETSNFTAKVIVNKKYTFNGEYESQDRGILMVSSADGYTHLLSSMFNKITISDEVGNLKVRVDKSTVKKTKKSKKSKKSTSGSVIGDDEIFNA